MLVSEAGLDGDSPASVPEGKNWTPVWKMPKLPSYLLCGTVLSFTCHLISAVAQCTIDLWDFPGTICGVGTLHRCHCKSVIVCEARQALTLARTLRGDSPRIEIYIIQIFWHETVLKKQTYNSVSELSKSSWFSREFQIDWLAATFALTKMFRDPHAGPCIHLIPVLFSKVLEI